MGHWLILCDGDDEPALWAHAGLSVRGLVPLHLVTADELAGARWEHRVTSTGASVEFELPGGRVIRGTETSGVLNRLTFVPQGMLPLFRGSDRDYVTHELHAFYLSWLHSLRAPVLNPPTPQNLCGPIRHISEWLVLASRAGLATPPFSQAGRALPQSYSMHARLPGVHARTVIVVGDAVVGLPVPDAVASGCSELSRLSGAPLLGVDFTSSHRDEWEFVGASTLPDLRSGGEALLDRLCAVFQTTPVAS